MLLFCYFILLIAPTQILAILNRDKLTIHYRLPPPVNQHGIEPMVLIKEVQQLKRNNLLAKIPILSTEWSLSFQILYFGTVNDWAGVIRLLDGSPHGQCGCRMPSIYTSHDTTSLMMNACIGNNALFELAPLFPTVPMGQNTTIEIHQRYIKNGQYKLFGTMNGNQMFNHINNNARPFYNVHVYAADNDFPASAAYISNFKITNFM